MNEADERFAARLSEDLDTYLGPEISLQELDLGDLEAGHAHLRATWKEIIPITCPAS